MRIDPVNPETATDAELDDWHEFCRRTDRFDLPGDPDPPRSATVGSLFGGEERRLTWFARADGQLVGGATLELEGHENAHFAVLYARVRPDARRTGIGTALLERALRVAVDDRRAEMASWTPLDGPGSAFAAAVGANHAQDEIRRVLRTADVDPGTVAEWAAGAASRVDGFEMVRWVDRCPAELLEPYARARDGMNDAPTGDVDWRPVRLTAERIRMRENTSVRRGVRWYVAAARERATGVLAGMTAVSVSPDSVRAEQDDTTVLGPYRGRGLGLWLKADMVSWLSGVEPHVTEYQTFNAAENAHMIAINERLGYRAAGTWQTWQLPLADLPAR